MKRRNEKVDSNVKVCLKEKTITKGSTKHTRKLALTCYTYFAARASKSAISSADPMYTGTL